MKVCVCRLIRVDGERRQLEGRDFVSSLRSDAFISVTSRHYNICDVTPICFNRGKTPLRGHWRQLAEL